MNGAFAMDGDQLFKEFFFDSKLLIRPRIVRWSLEQRCPLRQGDRWETPDVTHKQLRPAALLSTSKIHPDDDLAVTESTEVYFSPTTSVSIPDLGCRLSQLCQPLGGWPAVRDACTTCPANVQIHRAGNCVGCHGHLGFQVGTMFDHGFQQAVEAAGVKQQVNDLFPQTKQLWTRFWMTSPWRVEHAEVMLQILSSRAVRIRMGLGPFGDRRNDSFARFLLALNLSCEQEIPLHVELLPPFVAEQTDTYAHHCRFCKADSPRDWHTQIKPASDSSEQLTIDCPNCELPYDPAASSYPVEQLRFDDEPQDLAALLGEDEYWRFVYRSLLKDGHPKQLAERHVEWEQTRREKNPDTWQQRKHIPTGGGFPSYGPPCEHCGEYLHDEDATDCPHCGKTSSGTAPISEPESATSFDATVMADDYENPFDDFTAEQMAEEFDRPEEAVRVVRWALERECPYRQGDRWQLPAVTHEQLADLVDLCGRLGGDFKGVCVTDWTRLYYTPEDYLRFPDRGYRVEDAFAAYGGVDQATLTCGTCLANVNERKSYKHWQEPVAGCHGELKVVSDHPLFAPVVEEAIKSTGMEAAVAELFPATDPLWNGFWMRSPIRHKEAKVLYPIVKQALSNYEFGYIEGIEAFLDALARAELGNFIPLHVELMPPEAVAPLETVGFHCPFCKAPTPDTDFPPEKRGLVPQFPTIKCPVCGMPYSPLETRSLLQNPPAEEKDELLEELLGTEEYWEFAHRYLVKCGESAELAERYCRWERERREENPKTWERKQRGFIDEPDYGPPCSDCCEYLPSPESKQCKRCGAEQ